ncbi:MAG: GNAT family N-acetyltransferase [Oscillospiraceae bacterium]|nr:GNAT family N-acetyltransferase [Oscillospiraceae bacterium]
MLVEKISLSDCDTYKDVFVRFIYENNRDYRSVEPKDTEAAYELFSEMKSEIRNDTAIVYGAMHNGKLVGFIWASKRSFREDNSRMFLNIMCVDDEYKTPLVFEHLLNTVQKEAKHMGYKALFVYEEMSKVDKISFYKKVGFEIERIQLVKTLTGEEVRKKGLVASPEFIAENLSSFAKLHEENIHAHILTENFSYNDAVETMHKIIQYLKDGKASVYYESNEENIVGMIWIHPYRNMGEDRMHLSSIVVKAEYKGNAYGQKLFSAVYDEMITKGFSTIYTNVDAINSYAAKFYYKQGFVDEAYQMIINL